VSVLKIPPDVGHPANHNKREAKQKPGKDPGFFFGYWIGF
jgi:hypothetical protein